MKKKYRRLKRNTVKTFYKKFVEDLKESSPKEWYGMMKKLGGSDQKIQSKLVVESLKDLTDQEAVEEVARSMAAVSQSYQPLDLTKLPCYLPAQEPEQVTIFEVFEKIKTLKKTRSTLPIDLPDRLRIECAIEYTHPLYSNQKSYINTNGCRSSNDWILFC